MSRTTRWTVAILAAVVALTVALVAQLRDEPAPIRATGAGATAEREHRDADTPAALAGPRERAGLEPCPAGVGSGADGQGPSSLRGVTVDCVADGSVVDVGRALAGRRVVLNFWAYWCAPCAAELPALAEYQRRVGSRVTVLTVHQDENEMAALLRLAELGVRLPTFQDGRRRVAAALGVPNVMPATVVVRPDGSVATTMVRAFATADEIADAIGNAAG
jgi:thiol-disulfide isomerase/thioredoxin